MVQAVPGSILWMFQNDMMGVVATFSWDILRIGNPQVQAIYYHFLLQSNSSSRSCLKTCLRLVLGDSVCIACPSSHHQPPTTLWRISRRHFLGKLFCCIHLDLSLFEKNKIKVYNLQTSVRSVNKPSLPEKLNLFFFQKLKLKINSKSDSCSAISAFTCVTGT